MSRKGVRIVVVCEDEDHRCFSYHVLLSLGYHPRELRFEVSLQGRGAADQWVKSAYPNEVRAYRRQARHQKVAVLVVIDADKLAVAQRHNQLDDALVESQQQKRSDPEHIAIWVPKWHIETWIVFLVNKIKVDESKKYKTEARDLDYREAAQRFVGMFQEDSTLQVSPPSSVQVALSETRRLV